MQKECQFLGIKSSSFEKEGKEIEYHRIYVWDPKNFQAQEYPISGRAKEACEAQGTKFGDSLILNLVEGTKQQKTPNGEYVEVPVLKVIEW